MFKVLSGRTYAALAFFLFVLWFPKDWEDQAQAWAVWARWLGVLNREMLLWAFSVTLLAWLIWTDVRPFIQARLRRKFPARHAEICHQLAKRLGEMRSLAFSAEAWVIRDKAPAPAKRVKAINFSRLYDGVQRLAGEISYDTDTAQTVRDYAQICAIMVAQIQEEGAAPDEKEALNALTPPLFEALHAGRSVERTKLPLPKWALTVVTLSA